MCTYVYIYIYIYRERERGAAYVAENWKIGTYYNKDKTGNRFIKAFQLFKILKNDIGKLISPMPLTEEIMQT